MRRGALGAVAAATGVLALGAAAAQTPRFPTTIDMRAEWLGSEPNSVFFAGNVTSPKRACVAGRTVKVVVVYSDRPRQILDTDLTSKHGAWSGGGTAQGMNATDVFAKVARERIGRRHHHSICKPAKVELAA